MSRLRLRPTCCCRPGSRGGGGVARRLSSGSAISAATHAAAASAQRQLATWAIQGSVAAATRPPTGMPVWRMPSAVPCRFRGNASRTRRPPAGVALAPAAPASTINGTNTGSGMTEATSTIAAVASPPTRSVRCSPSRSAATPAAYAPAIRPTANDATTRPAAKAERPRSSLMKPVSVSTPWSTTETPNCTPTARPRIVQGERSARVNCIVPMLADPPGSRADRVALTPRLAASARSGRAPSRGWRARGCRRRDARPVRSPCRSS